MNTIRENEMISNLTAGSLSYPRVHVENNILKQQLFGPSLRPMGHIGGNIAIITLFFITGNVLNLSEIIKTPQKCIFC